MFSFTMGGGSIGRRSADAMAGQPHLSRVQEGVGITFRARSTRSGAIGFLHHREDIVQHAATDGDAGIAASRGFPLVTAQGRHCDGHRLHRESAVGSWCGGNAWLQRPEGGRGGANWHLWQLHWLNTSRAITSRQAPTTGVFADTRADRWRQTTTTRQTDNDIP